MVGSAKKYSLFLYEIKMTWYNLYNPTGGNMKWDGYDYTPVLLTISQLDSETGPVAGLEVFELSKKKERQEGESI